MANLVPDEFSKTINLALSGDFKEAATMQYSLLEINDFLFAEGNPAGLKSGLKHLRLMNDYLRPPLLPVSRELETTIKNWSENRLVTES